MEKSTKNLTSLPQRGKGGNSGVLMSELPQISFFEVGVSNLKKGLL